MERDLEGLRGETVASRQESSPAMTFEAHRPLLFSVAYRMLGSRADAEDMLQEAFLRWHQIDTREVRSARAFLVTIITRLCINYMQSAQVRREQYVGPWLPEPLITDSGSDLLGTPALDGSLSIAFLFLLERLSPTERAVFLLREVFDYEYSEIAEALNQNVANCRQILRRAKQRIAEGKARFNTTTQQREQVLQQFVQTSSDGNIEGLLALLSEDVVLYADGGGKVTAVPNALQTSFAFSLAPGRNSFRLRLYDDVLTSTGRPESSLTTEKSSSEFCRWIWMTARLLAFTSFATQTSSVQ
jgi:RNA polymerase sigma-70 factor, ECF subfamily